MLHDGLQKEKTLMYALEKSYILKFAKKRDQVLSRSVENMLEK
jgi:hypothetical protein